MITPFDSSRGNLRQRLRQSQFALTMPSLYSICTHRNLCKRTHLWPWAVEISTPYLARLSPMLGHSWSIEIDSFGLARLYRPYSIDQPPQISGDLSDSLVKSLSSSQPTVVALEVNSFANDCRLNRRGVGPSHGRRVRPAPAFRGCDRSN